MREPSAYQPTALPLGQTGCSMWAKVCTYVRCCGDHPKSARRLLRVSRRTCIFNVEGSSLWPSFCLEPIQRWRWGNFWETGWSHMGFSERVDTILNWTVLNWTAFCKSLPLSSLEYNLACFTYCQGVCICYACPCPYLPQPPPLPIQLHFVQLLLRRIQWRRMCLVLLKEAV